MGGCILSDRRFNERFNKVFSVILSGMWGDALGIARNISEGGMFVETQDPFPLGSKMKITFSYPNRDTEMTAEAEVVHLCFLNRTPAGDRRRVISGMGIRFGKFLLEKLPLRCDLPPVVLQ
jgi:Tfp pilus assembly protein PilZ